MTNVVITSVLNTKNATKNEMESAKEEGRITAFQAINQMEWVVVDDSHEKTWGLFFNSNPELSGAKLKCGEISKLKFEDTKWVATFSEKTINFNSLPNAKKTVVEKALLLLMRDGYVTKSYLPVAVKELDALKNVA